MRIELQPVSSLNGTDTWHHIFEMVAIFKGVCAVDEIEWDDDELLRSFLEQIDDPSIRADYEAEPQVGIQEAKDKFISDIFELIKERQEVLGKHSPFEIGDGGATLLTRRAAEYTTIAALAYACMSVFWALSNSSDYVIIEKDDRAAFIRNFAPVFEYICCLVVAGRYPSAVWYFGDSRNVREFLKRLNAIVSKSGNGTVKAFSDLEENQTGANDAGVDVMAVTTRNDKITRDATAYLVGATIQKSDRRNKIIGIDQVHRFTAYFSKAPQLQYGGILAIPYTASPAEGLNCRDKNCAYVSKDEIIENLSRLPNDVERLRYIRRPRHLLLKASREWQKAAVFAAREGELAVNWG